MKIGDEAVDVGVAQADSQLFHGDIAFLEQGMRLSQPMFANEDCIGWPEVALKSAFEVRTDRP